MYRTTRENLRRMGLHILFVSLIIVFFLIVGMIGFSALEGWSFKDSLYFSAISLATRGQSHLYPTTWPSVIFTITYLFVGVAILIYLISTVVGFYVSYYQDIIERKTATIVDRFKKNEKKDTWVHVRQKRL